MPGERKAIRDALETHIRTIFQGTIGKTRNFDAKNENEYINIFMDDGEVVREGLDEPTHATVVIEYGVSQENAQIPTDDDLDTVMDAVKSLISDTDFQDVARGVLYEGFDYPDSEDSFSKIQSVFTFIFDEQ